MEKILKLSIFINIIFSSFSIVPIWNFIKSTIDLLPNGEKYEYIKEDVRHDNLKFVFKKTIEKKNDTIIVTNNLTCYFTNNYESGLVVNQIVDFDDVESVYTDKDKKRYYICPKEDIMFFWKKEIFI